MNAVRNRHREIVVYLVENGADTAFDNDLAISFALDNGDKELADYLVKKARY